MRILSATRQNVGVAPTEEVSDDRAVVGDVGGLEDGPGELAEEAVAHVLRQHAQVHVEEAGLAAVDALPQVRVGLVGRAPRNGVGARQLAVERRAGGGAGDDADLERPAGVVLRLGAAGDGLGNDLGGAGGGEAAEADRLAMLDECRGFIGRQHGEGGARWFMGERGPSWDGWVQKISRSNSTRCAGSTRTPPAGIAQEQAAVGIDAVEVAVDGAVSAGNRHMHVAVKPRAIEIAAQAGDVAGLEAVVFARERREQAHQQRGGWRRLRQQVGQTRDLVGQRSIGRLGAVGDVQADADHGGVGGKPVHEDAGQLLPARRGCRWASAGAPSGCRGRAQR